jgi:MYXO-CTERM domain-containing protein
MNNSRTALVAAFLALCAGCGGPPEETPAGAPPAFVPGTGAHILPTVDAIRARGPEFAPPGSHLDYFGGRVLPSVKVQAVYWGSGVSPTVTGGIGGFFTSVTNSRHFDWLKEYDTNINAQDGLAGSNEHIGRGHYAGATTITPSVGGNFLDDSDIQQELDSKISSGALPAPDANTLYVTFFNPSTIITLQGQQSCQAFCGYHNTFLHNGQSTFYAVIPDPASCGGACDFTANRFDSVTLISSHELVEAVTDAEVGLATDYARPMAWMDQANGEIGDICVGIQDTIVGYVVQQEWSNQLNSCITFNPAVPEPKVGGKKTGPFGCGCDLAGGDASPAAFVLALAGLALAARRRKTA